MGETVKKILILDDEDAIRRSLIYYFEDQGWEVISAASAEEALKAVEEESPNASIVDIRLPGIAGDQFIYMAHDILPSLACVICTGSPDYHIPADLIKRDYVCDKVFDKPLKDIGQLEQAVLDMLGDEL